MLLDLQQLAWSAAIAYYGKTAAHQHAVPAGLPIELASHPTESPSCVPGIFSVLFGYQLALHTRRNTTYLMLMFFLAAWLPAGSQYGVGILCVVAHSAMAQKSGAE